MLNPPALRGFIFDFDGTVADTLPICYEAFRRAAAPYRGRNLTNEEIHATWGPTEAGSIRVLAPESPDECLEDLYRHYEDLHKDITDPFPGIRDALHELKGRGFRLGIVTGKGLRSLEISIKALQLENVFDTFEPGCPDAPCKPQAMASMLAEWDLPGEAILCMGDSPGDISAAHSVGASAAAALWATTLERRKALLSLGPELAFDSFGEFADWLRIHVFPNPIGTRP